MTKRSSRSPRSTRKGVALISVLYFLIVCGLAATALLFGQRSRTTNVLDARGGLRLSALADSALYGALAGWEPRDRLRQPIGATVVLATTPSPDVRTRVFITRATRRLFAIVSESSRLLDGSARRVSLLVRVPVASSPRGVLVSAVDATIGSGARIVADTACGDTTGAAVVLAPSVTLTIDSTAIGSAPSVLRDPVAADSATYLRFGDAWWNDLALAADVRLADGAHVTPMPVTSGGSCSRGDSNWGDPSSPAAPCAARVPIVYAAGDLTIDGGLGQGALLVDGHLIIAGPFTFSGQIVARGGIEMIADNITITGSVHAWRARGDTLAVHADSARVVLARGVTIRSSGCDAWHGVASWLQPRRVRDFAWIEQL
jgi:hypothetical protein